MSRTSVPPVIVIGMHRSGTSMITRMLERLGLFLGKQKDPNDEASFFLKNNRWLLDQCGGAWDHPEAITDLLENPEVRSLCVDYLRQMLRSRGRLKFLGVRRALRGQNLIAMDQAWGWKDPRNTFTLPIWLDLFPKARVIHISRHGCDVARSLKKRESDQLKVSKTRHRRRRWLYWLHPKTHGFVRSPRCLSIEEGIQLWDTYMKRAKQHVNHLGERAHSLRYESFLTTPRPELKDLADFCDLDTTDSEIRRCVEKVDASRSFAYRSDSQFTISSEAKRLLSRHDYEF